MVRFCLSLFLLCVLPACVKSSARSEEIESPPIVVTTRNLRQIKARCASAMLGSALEHEVQCNAVWSDNGNEQVIDTLPGGVRFDWESLKFIAGTEPKSVNCNVESSGTFETCKVVLNSPDSVTLQTILTATFISSGEQAISTADVVLPIVVRTFGQIRELPNTFVPASAPSGKNVRSAFASVQAEVPEGKSGAKLIERDFDAFDTAFVEMGNTQCSLGEETFAATRNFIYRFFKGRMTLFAGVPTWVKGAVQPVVNRRDMVFPGTPAIECVEGQNDVPGKVLAVSLTAYTDNLVKGRQFILTEIVNETATSKIVMAPGVPHAAKLTALALAPSGDWYFSVFYTQYVSPVTQLIEWKSQIFRYHPQDSSVQSINQKDWLDGERQITDLIIGTDGSLFFTDLKQRKLFKVDSGGEISEFAPKLSAAFSNARPLGIAMRLDKLYASFDNNGLFELSLDGSHRPLSVAPGLHSSQALSITRAGKLTSMLAGCQVGTLDLQEKTLKWKWVGGTAANSPNAGQMVAGDTVHLRNVRAVDGQDDRILVFESGKDKVTELGLNPSGEKYATQYLKFAPISGYGLVGDVSRQPNGNFLITRGLSDRSGPSLISLRSPNQETERALLCPTDAVDCGENALRMNVYSAQLLSSARSGEVIFVDLLKGSFRIFRMTFSDESKPVVTQLLDTNGLLAFQRATEPFATGGMVVALQPGPDNSVFFVVEFSNGPLREGKLYKIDNTGKLKLIAGRGTTAIANAAADARVETLNIRFNRIAVAQDGNIYVSDLLNRMLFVLHPVDRTGDTGYTFELLARSQREFGACGFGVLETNTTKQNAQKVWKATLSQVCLGEITAMKIVDQCDTHQRQSLLLAQKFDETYMTTVVESTRPCW